MAGTTATPIALAVTSGGVPRKLTKVNGSVRQRGHVHHPTQLSVAEAGHH